VTAPRHPNLLLLCTDQHRADILPSAGDIVVQAPNLARLAGESFDFRHAYCTQPLCTPSRGCLLTGLWPHHHGALGNVQPLRPDARTLAEFLPPGYATAYFGKWHLGNEIFAQHGFREWRSIEDQYRGYYGPGHDRNARSDYHRFLLTRGYPPDRSGEPGEPGEFSRNFAAGLPEPLSKAAFLADEAEKFLAGHDRRQPFVLTVSMLEPHPPTFGPLNQLYDPATLPVGAAFARPVGPDDSRHHQRRCAMVAHDGYKNHPLKTEADWRRVRANYYGLVTQVDHAIGRILAALDATGQAGNTIVAYTSDHGDMLGDHALMQKGVFYEQATRVPLLIRVPWLSPSATSIAAPFSHIDLMPTLLELVGTPVPSGLDGKSWAPRLRQPEAIRGEDIIVIWNDAKHPAEESRCLVTPDRWKCIFYHDDAPVLFDLSADPDELHNLARLPGHEQRIQGYAEKVRRWQQSVGDALALVF
jgi:arylsulfatase